MITTNDEHLKQAAANNADLHACVFKAHGLRFRCSDDLFWALDWPPPFFADLITLAPLLDAASSDRVREIATNRAQTSAIKDSFANIDLSSIGMAVLFEASWIRAHAPPKQLRQDGWVNVKNARELACWEQAWKAAGSAATRRMFPGVCLENQDWCFWGRRRDSKFKAGFIANRSSDVVGVSNVFGDENDASVFNDAASIAWEWDGGRPVVGYERGRSLEQALGCGFEAIGPLRVWVGGA